MEYQQAEPLFQAELEAEAERTACVESIAAFILNRPVFTLPQLYEALQGQPGVPEEDDFALFFWGMRTTVTQHITEQQGVVPLWYRDQRIGKDDLYALVGTPDAELAQAAPEGRLHLELQRLFYGRPMIESDELLFYLKITQGSTSAKGRKIAKLLVKDGFLREVPDGYELDPKKFEVAAQPQSEVLEPEHFELPAAQPGDELVGGEDIDVEIPDTDEIDAAVANNDAESSELAADTETEDEPEKFAPPPPPPPLAPPRPTPRVTPPKVTPQPAPAPPQAPRATRSAESYIPGYDAPFTEEEMTVAVEALKRLAWTVARAEGVYSNRLVAHVCEQLHMPQNDVVETLSRLVDRGIITFDRRTKTARLATKSGPDTPAFIRLVDRLKAELAEPHTPKKVPTQGPQRRP